MPLVVLQNTRLLWVRLAALIFACVAFSVAAHGAHLDQSIADWCMFCWIISFVGTLLVLIIEHLGLQSRIPVSWTNFPITLACYACLLCLSASIIFPLYEVKGYPNSKQRNYRITSTVFSCLATVAYLVEVSLTRAQPGEVAAYMATIPGLLKVCETFVASVIFVFISNPVSYNHHDALKWCLAVYCICFIISAAIVVVCVGECTGFLPFSFARFLSAYALLAALMYLSATIIWPVFQFDSHYSNYPKVYKDGLVIIAVLTALNFLIYVADLVYSARLVFVRA